MSLKYTFISEAVAQRCSVKKVFLEISQNSEENTWVSFFFFNKVAASGLRPVFELQVTKLQKQSSKDVLSKRCSQKFRKIRRKNTFARVPFLNKVASLSGTGCEFCEISYNTFSRRAPPVAASEITIEYSKKLQNILLSSTSKRQRCIQNPFKNLRPSFQLTVQAGSKNATKSSNKSFCEFNIFSFSSCLVKYILLCKFLYLPLFKNDLQVLLYKTFILIQTNIYVKTYTSMQFFRCRQDKTMVCVNFKRNLHHFNVKKVEHVQLFHIKMKED